MLSCDGRMCVCVCVLSDAGRPPLAPSCAATSAPTGYKGNCVSGASCDGVRCASGYHGYAAAKCLIPGASFQFTGCGLYTTAWGGGGGTHISGAGEGGGTLGLTPLTR